MATEAIELLALRDVYFTRTRQYDKVSPDFNIRRVFREYSRMFHTPLHVVYELPIDDVIQAYLEATFEDMDEKDLRAVIVDSTRDPSVLAALQRQEDEDDADSWDMIQQEKKLVQAAKKLDEAVGVFAKQMPIFSGVRDRETELINVATPKDKLPEGIHMSFTTEEFEDGESFGLLNVPKK